MAEDGKSKGEAFVSKVREATQKYLEGILEENQRLRQRLLLMQADHVQAEAIIESLRTEVRVERDARGQIEQQLADAEEVSRVSSEQAVEIEQRNAELASLYVASYRLLEATTVSAVLDVIREIVANLVGSESLALYELTGDGKTLVCVSTFGDSRARPRELRADAGGVGEALASGKILVRSDDAGLPEQAVACIPLRHAGAPVAVLLIYELLAQKTGLEALDLELFELLGTHAASALVAARLRERMGVQGLVALQGAAS